MLNLAVLDDLTWKDLLEEARAHIPTLDPSWTDHNPSDPGIVILELLAWLVEQVLFRVDQIPDENYWTFLELLNGPDWRRPEHGMLQEAIRSTVTALRQRYRAVTPDDYEHLALEQWPKSMEAAGLCGQARPGRVKCLAERNLEALGSGRLAEAPGHVSLVVLPEPPEAGAGVPVPSVSLLEGLARFFDSRRLVTTRVHVVSPTLLTVNLEATLYLLHDADAQKVRERGEAALRRFLDVWTGGTDGHGWPFGRNVYLSELYSVLEMVNGIDFVRKVRATTPERDRMLVEPDGTASRTTAPSADPYGIWLQDDELPQPGTLKLILMKPIRGEWQEATRMKEAAT